MIGDKIYDNIDTLLKEIYSYEHADDFRHCYYSIVCEMLYNIHIVDCTCTERKRINFVGPEVKCNCSKSDFNILAIDIVDKFVEDIKRKERLSEAYDILNRINGLLSHR